LRKAVEDTVRVLRRQDRLGPEDGLLVALLRTCADRADNRSLSARERRQWARQLGVLEARLRGVGAPIDSEFAELLRAAAGDAG
jgi:hypothetical protein